MPYYDQTYTSAAITAAGVLGTAYVGYKLYQSQKPRLPTTWKQVGFLKDLYIYPIKSLGAVTMEKAEVTVLGLRQGWLRDRTLMVVDDKYNFITARIYPELLTVYPTMKSSILTLKHPSMEPLVVNLAEMIESGIEPKASQVWNVPVPVYDCGHEASEWFSKFLNRPGKTFRLALYASQKPRMLKTFCKFCKFTKDDTGAFPDEVSYHLINEASVEDLNERVKTCEITYRNFRPNFLMNGAEAYDEDNWKYVKIGDNVFEIIKACGRCVLTTIDPETGVHNSNSEPLKTLNTYRQIVDPVERKAVGSAPRMGLQMALRSGPGGFISVNDPIYAA